MGEHRVWTTAAQALRDDRRRGAGELARQAVADLVDFVERCATEDGSRLLREASGFAAELSAARPSMPSIANLVGRWLETLPEGGKTPAAEIREGLVDAARGVLGAAEASVEALADQTARLIAPGSTVITLSRSSSVAGVFRRLAGRDVRAIVAESRPLLEGQVIAAELADLGIPTELITDAQIGLFAQRANLALVGADAILVEGSVVNKAGTSLLALAARHADVPFWVSAESHKRSPLGPDDFPLEEMEASALGAAEREHLTIRNVGFDVTPPALVTRWIDEDGSSLSGPWSA